VSDLIGIVNSELVLFLVLLKELNEALTVVELNKAELGGIVQLQRRVLDELDRHEDLVEIGGGELEEFFQLVGCFLGLVAHAGQVSYEDHVVQEGHYVLVESELLIKVLLIEVRGLLSKGIQYDFVLLLIYLDARDPWAAYHWRVLSKHLIVGGQLDVLV
jgi:hypothetical protein